MASDSRQPTKQARRKLAREELKRHVRETPFRRDEVVRIWDKFTELDVHSLGKLTFKNLIDIPELRCNPFVGRIIELFSGDGSGELDFNQFIHMLGVFSPRASVETKMVWAFALWDFDGDDLIGNNDIKKGLMLLTNARIAYLDGEEARQESKQKSEAGTVEVDLEADRGDSIDDQLTDSQIQQVLEKIAEEIDPEGLGLMYSDFESIASRMPDFIDNFRMSV